VSGEPLYGPASAAPGMVPNSSSGRSTVERKPVLSSNLQSVGYDEKTGEMHVEFKNGKVVSYSGVQPFVYRNMLRSPSVGKFFHANFVATRRPFTTVES
jgi:hypothetical protein